MWWVVSIAAVAAMLDYILEGVRRLRSRSAVVPEVSTAPDSHPKHGDEKPRQ
jgi:hypothetical protein